MMHSETHAAEARLSPSCFTGKERDTESGNDYFGARYYASTMGRFMSPDWSAKAEPAAA
jgi:RHS repeat-associated protein